MLIVPLVITFPSLLAYHNLALCIWRRIPLFNILVHDAVNTRPVDWCFYLRAGWKPAPQWGRLPAGLKLHYAIWLRI